MTASIKEVLERCRNYIASPLRMSNDDDEKKRRDDIVMCADQALASLESGDARERVAQAVTAELERMYKDGAPMCMREGETTWRTYYAGFDLSMFANRIVDAILATGLVPDEAAVRADEREKCAQEAFTAVTHVVIPDDGNTTLADHVAAAIRAGGAK